MAKLWLGTSGWVYKHWRNGVFYPAGLSQKSELSFYTEHFDSVELNNSFYHLPPRSTFSMWKRNSPADFTFAVKASRYLTHMRKLREPDDPLKRLIEAARGLETKLGPILFQFPASWHSNTERLSEFMDALKRYRFLRWSFEFRHKSWLNEETYHLLASRNAALCIPVAPGLPLETRLTSDWTYVRFHHGKYGVGYSRAELEQWASRLAEYMKEGADVYAYFNNDTDAHAISDARQMAGLLEHRGSRE